MKLDRSTVLVTGGTGFLGRAVARDLRERGARVIAVGRQSRDLRERREVDRLLSENAPDAIVHLAAIVGGIGANAASPGRFFYENARMGIELLDSARVAEIPKVVIAGSVCSYPKNAPVPFREEDLWAGYPDETNAPYGLAKRLLMVQAEAYRSEYGCNFVTLLPANLYGPGDNFDPETSHVIPALLRRFIEAAERGDATATVWGDGSASREFLYVDDCAEAFCLALEHYDEPEPLNIGTGEETSIKDLVALLVDITGFSGTIEWDTSRPNGQLRRMLSTKRAAVSLGWHASMPLRAGLERTAAWWIAGHFS
jgi:GDP-L-fucose synthase